MIKNIAVIVGTILAVLLLGFAAVIAMQPDEFAISRSAKMKAAPDVVFEQVNDFHNWDAWSPWAKLDPNAKNSFSGPESGKDAKFWSGNDQVGEGSMLITESQSGKLVRMDLAFVKPMQDTSETLFTFAPEGEQTKVTWTMSGKYPNFMHKAICKCMNMDKMIGSKFDEGLASLKTIVEKPQALRQEKFTPDQPAAPTSDSAGQ